MNRILPSLLILFITGATISPPLVQAQGNDECRRAQRVLEKLERKETRAEGQLVKNEEKRELKRSRWEDRQESALQRRREKRIQNCSKAPGAFVESCSSVSDDSGLTERTTSDKLFLKVQRKERGLFAQVQKILAKVFSEKAYDRRRARILDFLVRIGEQISELEDFIATNCTG